LEHGRLKSLEKVTKCGNVHRAYLGGKTARKGPQKRKGKEKKEKMLLVRFEPSLPQLP
jgi:hypothetical protein